MRWRIHLASPPDVVFEFLATDAGRARFRAEAADVGNDVIEFAFPNGMRTEALVRATEPPHLFRLDYFGSPTEFRLESDGAGGSDLTLTATEIPSEHRAEIQAGWVSVLLALKAACDFGVDLRNHDPTRNWDQGYADN